MATVTGFTAARMKQIEDDTIVAARLSGDNLILTNNAGVDINVGSVRGLQGTSVTTATTAETLAGTISNKAVAPTAVATNISTTGLAKVQFIPAGGTVTGSPGAYALIIELGA